MVRQRRWRQAEDSMVPSTNKDLPTQRFKQIWLDVIHQVLGWVAPVFGLLVHVLSGTFRAWFLIPNSFSIVLVDQSECFVFKPMLYELLSGARLVLALGAESKLDVVPGAVEFAIPFSMLEDAPRLSELESSDTLTGADENSTEVVPDFEKYILELQPAERGMQSKIVEADLVLWTAGTKPPLPQLEPSDVPFAIPLNARGQAETDETTSCQGSPPDICPW
ncbi:NADH dehydrogenase C1, chloroplastic/mitochondrial [Glycine soja]|nr:NADH dehydrogenase C1, chloroplastic/mitochondrial [Glycine soja]